MKFIKQREEFYQHLSEIGKTTYNEQDIQAYFHDKNQENLQRVIDYLKTLEGTKPVTTNDLIEVLEKIKS